MGRRILMTVTHADGGGEPWTETYDEGTTRFFPVGFGESQLEHNARAVVDFFNSTRVGAERERRFVSVTSEIIKDAFDHDWSKTNLMTLIYRDRAYDVLRCARCGVTAKRYGLGHIVRDRAYRAKKYETCKKLEG